MVLIDDIPIESQELKEKANKLMDEQEKVKQQLDREMVFYEELSKQSHNFIIFDDNDQIELILNDEAEQSKYYFDDQPFNTLFLRKELVGSGISLELMRQQELCSFRLLTRFAEMIKNQLMKRDEQTIQIFTKQIQVMKQILRRTEFISKDDVPTHKGKIASLIFGTDELVLTEILFSGILKNLEAKQLITILTLFINEEKMKPDQTFNIRDPDIHGVYVQIREIVQYFTKVFLENDIPDFDEESLMQKLNPNMFQIIQSWYEGRSFLEITKQSDMYEGSIIRNIKRLYELLKQLIECSSLLGNKEIREKLIEGSNKIYRGIAFSASLYIEETN